MKDIYQSSLKNYAKLIYVDFFFLFLQERYGAQQRISRTGPKTPRNSFLVMDLVTAL